MVSIRELMRQGTVIERSQTFLHGALVGTGVAVALAAISLSRGQDAYTRLLLIGTDSGALVHLTGKPDTRARGMLWTIAWMLAATLLGGASAIVAALVLWRAQSRSSFGTASLT